MFHGISEAGPPTLSGANSEVHAGAARDVFIVWSADRRQDAGTAAADAYARIGDALRAERLAIVQERVFASLSVEAAVRAARDEALLSRGIRADGPLTYLQGSPTWGDGLAGVILHTIVDDRVQLILDDGTPRGRMWQTDDATFIVLQGIHGLSLAPGDDNSPSAQALRSMERADSLLRTHGADYRNTVRTWFYLSDILSWYGEFNRVRNAKYGDFGLLPRYGEHKWRLPASTGIRADFPNGAACSLDLLAVRPTRPKAARLTVDYLRNPRQQEAFCYGSAFSRCAAVRGAIAGETLIEISGTAAIDEAGRSLHRGDLRAQVRCTMEKVASLLEEAGASFRDIRAATVFVKNGNDADVARDVLADMRIDHLPAVWVVADVCRRELLFEIDAEAVMASPATVET